MPESERKNREEYRISVGHSQCNLDQIPTTDLLSTDAMPNIVLPGPRRSVHRMLFWAGYKVRCFNDREV
jgi:hypothetical protein